LCAPEQANYFRFSGNRYSLQIVQASKFLERTDSSNGVRGKCVDSAKISDKGYCDQLTEVMCGHIVLIGGNYTAARDDYWTPFGKIAGVELIANAIESELQGHIHLAPTWLKWLTDLLAGSLIVYFYYRWHACPGIALVASCLAMVGPFVIAWPLYQWFALWLNVAPVMGGMVIHQMCESSAESAHP
jgi:CHASE2 domain-containing sensor protein